MMMMLLKVELTVRLAMVWLCTLLLYAPPPPAAAARASRKGVWRRVEAVSGREAVLACEVGAFDSSDMVFVVLWYRNGDKEPIYSYDNRPGRLLQAPEDRHTIKSKVLEGRATFRPGQVPALHIKPVLSSDQANYTCRVDFRIASSRRTHLSLWVVEPPSQPILRVGERRVMDGVLGPLQEDTALAITCSVAGGVPPPTVVWERDGKVVDTVVESRQGEVTVNELRVLRLSRGFHNAHLSCTAANNNVTSPVTASVTVTMNLRPLVTRLDQPPRSLRVGQEYQILCISAGSRPHPNITWTLGNVATLAPIVAQTEHGVNMSTSRVTVTASRRHHGQRLSCTSLNPLFPAYPLADSILLNVTYPPVSTIELGRGMASVVLEGQDVYFNCNVDSNPPTYKISWYRNERPLYHTPEDGVVLTVNSLALRSVNRHQAGAYVCSASNVEGDARSSPLNLTVNYAPVCEELDAAAQVYAAGVGQTINITCGVLASPTVVKFSWVFNNSIKSERLPGNQVFLKSDGRSVAQFRARDQRDYGTLQCWAQNTVGRMARPCLFHIIPAGRPERPVQCSVVNKSYDSLAVGCTPGFDGGLSQTFKARVFEAVTGRGQVNATSRWANFTLRGLTPGLDYIIEVVATNSLGDSEPVMLDAFTYKMAENRMRDEKVEEVSSSETQEEFAIANLVLVVAAVGLVVVVVVVAVVARCVVARRQQEEGDVSMGTLPPAPAEPGGSLASCPVRTPHTEVEFEMEDLVLGGSALLPPVPPRPPEKK